MIDELESTKEQPEKSEKSEKQQLINFSEDYQHSENESLKDVSSSVDYGTTPIPGVYSSSIINTRRVSNTIRMQSNHESDPESTSINVNTIPSGY